MKPSKEQMKSALEAEKQQMKSAREAEKQQRKNEAELAKLDSLQRDYPLFYCNWFDSFSRSYLEIEIRRHNKTQVRVNTANDRGGSYDDGPRRTYTEHIYNIKDCSFSIERQNAFVFRTPEKDFRVDIYDEEGDDSENNWHWWEPDCAEQGYIEEHEQFPFMIKQLEAAGIKQTPL